MVPFSPRQFKYSLSIVRINEKFTIFTGTHTLVIYIWSIIIDDLLECKWEFVSWKETQYKLYNFRTRVNLQSIYVQLVYIVISISTYFISAHISFLYYVNALYMNIIHFNVVLFIINYFIFAQRNLYRSIFVTKVELGIKLNKRRTSCCLNDSIWD